MCIPMIVGGGGGCSSDRGKCHSYPECGNPGPVNTHTHIHTHTLMSDQSRELSVSAAVLQNGIPLERRPSVSTVYTTSSSCLLLLCSVYVQYWT